MDIRLNKLISDAGICSRREADNFIKEARVTVNGKQPSLGTRVKEGDVVLVDGESVNVSKYIRLLEKEKAEEARMAAEGGAVSSSKVNPHKSDRLTYSEFLAKEAATPNAPHRKLRKAGDKTPYVNPKSASLRKSSRNHPANKAKRIAQRKYGQGGRS